MIEPTDEMVHAFTRHFFTCFRDADVRAALAAVLTIVERDWNMQPNPNAGSPTQPRWRCNTTERCVLEDGHDGPHGFRVVPWKDAP